MENPAVDIEHRKLFNTSFAASKEHKAAFRAWSEAPYADQKKLLAIATDGKIRADRAYAAWRDFWLKKTQRRAIRTLANSIDAHFRQRQRDNPTTLGYTPVNIKTDVPLCVRLTCYARFVSPEGR